MHNRISAVKKHKSKRTFFLNWRWVGTQILNLNTPCMHFEIKVQPSPIDNITGAVYMAKHPMAGADKYIVLPH